MIDECGCCGRQVTLPYYHSGRDGRPDTAYCQDCYDASCDLVECEFLAKAGRVSHALDTCGVCGREIDDPDIAKLGYARFKKVLCVTHYLDECTALAPAGTWVSTGSWAEEVGKKLRHTRAHCDGCARSVPLDDNGKFVSHDQSRYTRLVCPGSGQFPDGPPTDEELAEVYRSLGVEPPTPDAQWNQDQEDST